MRLAAEFPGVRLEGVVAACCRLGLTGTGFDVDVSWTADAARGHFGPCLDAGLEIVQLGCYRNLISADESVRAAAVDDVARAMDVAGQLGVRFVVSGSGHRDPERPAARRAVHPGNWSEEALDVLVESCREIARRAGAGAAALCLEPWVMLALNTPARLERVVRAVDHEKVCVELDIANLVTLEHYFRTGALIDECFRRFGDKIRLAHVKDVLLKPEPYVYQIREAIPGDGDLDLRRLLELMAEHSPAGALLIEHLDSEPEIERAVRHVRAVAARTGVTLD